MTSQIDDYDVDECQNEDEFGESPPGAEICLVPGRCCMPGAHYESECHTADMLGEVLHSANAAAPSAGNASGATIAATAPNVSRPA